MSDIIRLLPDSVANQIAAGEVIQRPASVVKELVENAVDAGATVIDIIIKDAGRTLVQIVDNGSGMSDTDARLAFERHATSKIAEAKDLFSLHTMGFRGEALASIAAVAMIDMRTMLHDAPVGTRLIINGSKVESQEADVCTPGTNIMVKNLFFNVPARRKFLKKDSVELANIMREFERLALVNPDIEFSLTHNGTTLHRLLRAPIKQRIVDLFGKSLDKQLIPVVTATAIVKISGFVSLPQFARRRNALQYLTVNGRNMRHPYFHKAVMHCYENLIPADEQPNYFLDFKVEPASIDVNIHPTKNEIKFEDEPAIWQIIVAAVKESLGRYNATEAIDFDREDAPDIPVFNPNVNTGDLAAQFTSPTSITNSYNPFGSSSAGAARAMRQAGSDWAKLYEDFSSESAPKRSEGVSASALNDFTAQNDTRGSINDTRGESLFNTDGLESTAGAAGTCIQVKGRFILSPSRSGVMIIDQHRAHIKVLYERFMAQLANGGSFNSQRLLFPEVITVSTSQNAVMQHLVSELPALGFDVSFLGDNSWSINGTPAIDSSPVDTLLKIIEAESEGTDAGENALRGRAALAMARAGAVKNGQLLTAEEMERLISELFTLPAPNYTPDGLLIVSLLSTEDILRMFA